MKQSKIKKIALIISICALTVIGTVTAFLTSTDTVNNLFRIAKVDLKIEEKFDEKQKLSAGQIITKQPWVKNTGTVNELFFVEISVPCMEASFLTSDGQRIIPDSVTLSNPPKTHEYLQTQEIYNLIAAGTPSKDYITQPVTVNNITKNWELSYNKSSNNSEGWVYLSQTESQKEYKKVQGMQDGIYNTYLLGYSAWVAPDKVTVPIFDKLQLRSIIDADIENNTIGQVQLNAYTIQADELNLSGLTGNGSDIQYTKADLKKIYKIISNKHTTA